MEFFVVAEEEIVLGFGLIGIQGKVAVTREEAMSAFRYATSLPDLKVLILTEEISSTLDDVVVEWNMSGSFPLIVEIPGLQGRIPGKKTLVDSIREAVGINV